MLFSLLDGLQDNGVRIPKPAGGGDIPDSPAAAAGCDLNEEQRETLTTFVFVAEALKRKREREILERS